MEENKKYKGKRKKTFIIVGLIIVFILSNFMFFYIGNLFAFNGLSLISVSEDVAKDISEIKDVKKYELLFQVRDALLTKYDGELDDNSLLEAAIKGMTQSVNDPYTVFMNASEYKAFEDQIEGHFVGIGAQLGIKDDKITVVSPIEGSPAEKAGISAGDVITKFEGNNVSTMSGLKEKLALKKANTKVKITFKRANQSGTYEEKTVTVTLGKKSDFSDVTTDNSSDSSNDSNNNSNNGNNNENSNGNSGNSNGNSGDYGYGNGNFGNDNGNGYINPYEYFFGNNY